LDINSLYDQTIIQQFDLTATLGTININAILTVQPLTKVR